MAVRLIVVGFLIGAFGLLVFGAGSTRAEPVAVQDFAAAPDVSGAGPHDLGGGWQAFAFDAGDGLTEFTRPEDLGGGWLMQRGNPWAWPGAFVVWTGDRAYAVRTIRSVIEFRSDGGGDNAGRVTWLAAFVEELRAQPLIALQLDTAGTNGTLSPGGGPGDYDKKEICGGLKLTGSLLKDDLVTGREGVNNEPFILLSPQAPEIGHTYQSSLGWDPATGRVSVLLYDQTDGELLHYDANLLACSPAQGTTAFPKVGGFNGYANWATDKAFALRLRRIELDDAFTPGPP